MKIKVLIVDNSIVFRQIIHKILSTDPDFEVIATASDPYIAAKKIAVQVPDLIIMPVEMPRMDGLSFLKKIMSQHPLPVVMILNEGDQTDINFKAFELGAAAIVYKNQVQAASTNAEKANFCKIVKAAVSAKIKRKPITEKIIVQPKLSADAVLRHIRPKNMLPASQKIIGIGASTGGVEAIRAVLESFSANTPGILIVQHMPENFTKSFAERLDQSCALKVKEAEDGDLVTAGEALVAPGNHHMLLRRRGTQYYVEVQDGPLVNRHRPAVDVLFRSIAIYAGEDGIGVLLTGMGDDGAIGLLEIKEAGGQTIAQDEASCVVFGMPKEAILRNAANYVLPLNEIASSVTRLVSIKRKLV